MTKTSNTKRSDIINIHLLQLLLVAHALLIHTELFVIRLTLRLTLLTGVIRPRLTRIIQELNTTLTIMWTLILTNLEVLWHFIERLELPDLVGSVFENDVALLVLELTQAAH